MAFDAQGFLDRYAGAYNGRDPEEMRTFFDLSDARFAVFAAVTPGQTIVKARGQLSLGGILANEVQIEPTLDN